MTSMLAARNAHRAGTFLASFLLAAVLGGSTSQATVTLGLYLNPLTTAGGGATSTRSGSGSWQLYALDDSNTDFGISSYNITMSGTTAINHRSPVTTVQDSNGDPQTAGFSYLRSGTNANPILGSQGLPGSTPFLITGFGQTASNFITKAKAIDPGAAVVGPTTSGSWGTYTNSQFVPVNGHNWMFLAEGLGPSGVTQVTSATATVFSTPTGTSVAAPTQVVNISDCLDCLPLNWASIDNVVANDPGIVMQTMTSRAPGPLTWFDFRLYPESLVPAIPATFDPTTQKFSWNTIGSAPGQYTWTVRAVDQAFVYGFAFIHVRIIAVPEPATLSLLSLATAGIIGIARRRRV